MTGAGEHEYPDDVLEAFVLDRLDGGAQREIEKVAAADSALRCRVDEARVETARLIDTLARGADAAHGPADDEILAMLLDGALDGFARDELIRQLAGDRSGQARLVALYREARAVRQREENSPVPGGVEESPPTGESEDPASQLSPAIVVRPAKLPALLTALASAAIYLAAFLLDAALAIPMWFLALALAGRATFDMHTWLASDGCSDSPLNGRALPLAVSCGVAFAMGVFLPEWNIPIFVLAVAMFWAAIVAQVDLTQAGGSDSQVAGNEPDSDEDSG